MWHIGGDPKVAKGIETLNAELRRGSDRAIGIIAGSIVETYVTQYLERATQHYGKMWEELTRPSGPLGSFGVKIDVAYMSRLISKEAHRDLVQMKDCQEPIRASP